MTVQARLQMWVECGVNGVCKCCECVVNALNPKLCVHFFVELLGSACSFGVVHARAIPIIYGNHAHMYRDQWQRAAG